MKSASLAGSIAACLCIAAATPLHAAEPLVTGTARPPTPGAVDAAKAPAATEMSAEKCLKDLRAFGAQMEKDGYWLGGSGYTFGYPVGEPGLLYGSPSEGNQPSTMNHYPNARPGYEVRNLMTTATILARHGQQQPCEDVLATTREIYKGYVTHLLNGKAPTADVSSWRHQEIAAAQPVATQNVAFRSDQLIGTAVRTPRDEALGSVDDLVMSPQTGKIAYLIVARGGIFGIGEKYTPVPWEDFKASPNVNMLVLDTTSDIMAAAPRVEHDQFSAEGQFDQESLKVNAYWKTHLSDKGKD
ncbi:MAG: PRC-barrel domain-containing protein [Xanthobacteraceae bacterium]